jgi:GrpB-like predicted nucleotidyltransferase (UPF0157 family)
MMIGLKRNAVQVVDYDPGWAVLFEVEAQAISRAAGDLSLKVEHVGSTAVPGLPAKPIVDIAVAIQTRDSVPILAQHLTTIDYIDRGDAGAIDGGYLLVKESEPDVRVVHLHIVEESDIQWRRYIEFRDILRLNDTVRKQYADLKTQLGAQFRDDRKSYTEGKSNFIGEVLRVKNAAQPSPAANSRGGHH